MLINALQATRSRLRQRRAAAARAAVEHPHLVSARLDAVRGNPVRVIVELCPAPAISELRPLSAPECAELIGGLTSAVRALERHGLCARDITPDHVHFDARSGARLRDTGLPVDLFPRPPVDRDRHLPYRSPEELAGAQPDARSAVYSLGAVLFHALTGRAPFGGAWSRIYLTHTEAARPRPSEHRRGVSPELDAVVARAMAVDRADRYPSPRALATAVAEAAGTSVLDEWATSEPAPLDTSGAGPDSAGASARSGADAENTVVSNGQPATRTEAPEHAKSPVTAASRLAERLGVAPGAGARLAGAMRSGPIVATPKAFTRRSSSGGMIATRSRRGRTRGPKPSRVRSRASDDVRVLGRDRGLRKTPRLLGERLARTSAWFRQHAGRGPERSIAIVGAIAVAAAAVVAIDVSGEDGSASSRVDHKDQAGRSAAREQPGPPTAGAQGSVRRVLVELADKRLAARARIASGANAEGAIEAARSLESAYATASRRLRDDGPPGQTKRTLVAGIDAAARAYGELAAAMQMGDQTAYDEARADVTAAEASVWAHGAIGG